MREIVVGDIHGCYPEFVELLRKIQFDERYDRLILLGDIIDRGDYSCELFRYLRKLKSRIGTRLVILKGNHEDMYLKAAKGDFESERLWQFNGRATTYRSFLRKHTDVMSEQIWGWFDRILVPYYESEQYQCVHAGLTSERPADNAEHDLIWNRTMLEEGSYSGKLTIVGHTPVDEPIWKHDGVRERLVYGEWFDLPTYGLIALDTGCVFYSKLSAMIIRDGRAKLESVSRGKELPEDTFGDQPLTWKEREREERAIQESMLPAVKREKPAESSSCKNRQRVPLHKDDEIRLYHDGTGTPGTWKIYSDSAKQGGSCLVYRAEHDGIRGVLKEFFPADLAEEGILVRGENRKVIPKGIRKSSANSEGVKLDDARRKFRIRADQYRHSYDLLKKIKNSQDDLELLNIYMPMWEILWDTRPISGKKQTTVSGKKQAAAGNLYIWSPNNPKGEVFEDILRRWRVDASTTDPYRRTADTLETILAMAKCIGIFHHNHFLHLDIKPDNFMVANDRRNHLDYSKTLLFDIDTIHHESEGAAEMVGTHGFADVWSFRTKAPRNARNDLYSLGASLFYALCTIDGNGVLYIGNREPEEILESTEMFRNMDEDFREKLLAGLQKIFRNTLAQNEVDRYTECKDVWNVCDYLIRDLEEVLELVQSRLREDQRYTGEHLRWIYDGARPHANAKALMQDLLYRYPIYNWTDVDQKEIHVLVLGEDEFCHEYIDAVLQAMQVYGCTVHVVAASANAETNCSMYLRKRPMLSRFVTIELEQGAPLKEELIPEAFHQPPTEEESYGRITFRTISDLRRQDGFVRNGMEINGLMCNILMEEALKENEFFSTVFVSLEDSDMNRQIAAILSNILDHYEEGGRQNHHRYVIHYAQEQPEKIEKDEEQLHPIDITREILPEEISPELFQRAFNCHAIWNQGADAEELKESFLDEKNAGYNYQASLAYALSIGYKFWSIGIDVADSQYTAAQFRQILMDKELEYDENDAESREQHRLAEVRIRRLTALEHRRWVLEKICQGYKSLEWNEERSIGMICADLCNNRDMSDPEHPKHFCICFSDDSLPLVEAQIEMINHENTAEYSRYKDAYYDLWDHAPLESLRQQMDDLDYSSVVLHRELMNFDYQKIYGSETPWNVELMKLKRSLQQMNGLACDIRRNVYAIENIILQIRKSLHQSDRTSSAAALRNELKALRMSILGLPVEYGLQKSFLTRTYEELQRILYPLMEGNRYIDYKRYDYDLICGLVDIITYGGDDPKLNRRSTMNRLDWMNKEE